jgi:hypothetical protein
MRRNYFIRGRQRVKKKSDIKKIWNPLTLSSTVRQKIKNINDSTALGR